MPGNNYLVDNVAPADAYIILTLKCNSRCKHCYIEAGPDRTESMPMPLRKKVIDEVAKNGIKTIKFSGGEVTLLEDLADTLNYAKKTGNFDAIVVETNAYFLNGLGKEETREKLAKLKAAGATTLYIASDDAYHSMGHDGLEKIGKLAKKVFGSGNVSVYGVMTSARPIGRARREVPEKEWNTDFYGHHYTDITVAVDGGVYPCCWQATPPVGNLSEEPLSEILARARTPDSLFRKLAENGGFSGLGAGEIGMGRDETEAMVNKFGNCGACYEHYRSLKTCQEAI